LLDDCGVPPSNITVLASPVDGNGPLLNSLDERGVTCIIRLHFGDDVFQKALGRFQYKSGRLWLCWAGHRVLGSDGNRCLLLGNYSDSLRSVIRVATVQNRIRSAAGRFPPDQVLVFDTCATPYDEYEQQGDLVYETHDVPSNSACRQFLMFASEVRTPAMSRDGAGGVFTRELIGVLKGDVRVGGGPPRLDDLHGELQARFDVLRESAKDTQRPVRYTWRAPSGEGDENVVLIPRLGPQHDPAPFLRAVAEEMSRSPFPWPLVRGGIDFFRDLHVRVRVGPRRRDPLKDLEQERRLGAGMAMKPAEWQAPGHAYRPSADEALFKERPASPPKLWFEPDSAGKSAREQFPWAVVLGDPGLGKSTLLRYDGWVTAREGLAALENASLRNDELLVPIYIRLAELATVIGASRNEDALSEALARAGAEPARGSGYDPEDLRRWLARKLQAGKVVLLLDALDELTADEHKALVPRLDGWVRVHRPRRLYITSRQAGYRGLPPALKGGAEHELELVAFTPDEVRRYVTAYFGADPRADALRAQLDADPGILGLAQIPLLSALICLVVCEGPAESASRLPDTRSGLIARCLDVLLMRWARIRRGGYDPEEAPGDAVALRGQRDFLAGLARELMAGDPEHTLFTEVKVAAALGRVSASPVGQIFGPDTQAAMDTLARQVGILTRSGRPPHARYLFLHRTFQEYLLSWSIARRGDWRDHLARHVYDPAWREPLAMLGGAWEQIAGEEGEGAGRDIADEARSCIEWLLQENARDLLGRPFLLACDVAAEGRRLLPESLAQGLVDALVDCAVGDLPATMVGDRARFRDPLSRQGLAAVGPLLRALDEDGGVRARAAEALGVLGRSDPSVLHALCNALRDESWWVQTSAALALGVLGRSDLPVIDALHAALRDKHSWVRRDAARALGVLGRSDPPVLDALRAALRDQDAAVGATAAEARGALGRFDPLVIDALRADLHDKNSVVRASAAQALGVLGRTDPPVLADLRDALCDEDRAVRASAAEALGVLGRSDLTVLDALHAALRDEDAWVRAGVAVALGRLGRSDRPVLDALLADLRDESPWVRGRSVEALGVLGRTDPPVLDALLAALRDQDAWVRAYTTEALGVLGRSDSSVIDALRTALRDQDGPVRGRAAKALGVLGRSDLTITKALRDALRDEDAWVRGRAAEALGRPDPSVIDALFAALRDEHGAFRTGAAEELGSLGRSSPALIHALSDDVLDAMGWVRASAAVSLWRISARADRRLPTGRASRRIRKIHQAWNQQLLSLVSSTPAPWWRKLWRWGSGAPSTR
jgi:HEAT repeat protein